MRRCALLMALLIPAAIAVPAHAETGTGSIEGQWFYDRNGDQVRQPDEPGFVGSLDIKILMDTWVATAHTDSTGHFRVDGLQPGEYRVVPQTGSLYGPTSPNERQVTVTDGGVVQADFSTEGGEISGVAWVDRNRDGQRQAGEPPLPGVAVRLNTWDSPLLVTGPDGGYHFYDLNMTTYHVLFELKDHMTFSPPLVGPAETDSDVIDFDEGFATATISRSKPSGVNDAVHIDAGYVPGR